MRFRTTIAVIALSLSGSAELGWSQMGDRGAFGGPSILSSAGSPFGRMAGAPLGFRVYGALSGVYDTNLAANPDSTVISNAYRSRLGGRAGWGTFGVHRGQRSMVGLDYHGEYRYFEGNSRNNGASHFATLNYSYQLSSRTQFHVAPSAASYSYAQTGVRNSLIQNPITDFNDPSIDPFDVRTTALAASGGVIHMLSSRTSISFSGSGFRTRRDNPALLNSQGATAGASLRYMIGADKSIGGSYRYFYFFFPNGFGQTRMHSATFDYTQQLSDVWSLQLGAGGLRTDNERLTQVRLDPILAAITGQSALLQAYQNISFHPLINFTVGRRFQNGSLSFFLSRTITPGTAFQTTSLYDRGGVQYSYTATERVNIGFNFQGQRASALTQDVGRFSSIGGGVGVSYRIWEFMHFTCQANVRRWKITGALLDRDRLNLSVGLTFSPGERPLTLF